MCGGRCLVACLPYRSKFAEEIEQVFGRDVVGEVLHEECAVDILVNCFSPNRVDCDKELDIPIHLRINLSIATHSLAECGRERSVGCRGDGGRVVERRRAGRQM